ncbi:MULTISPECIES: helix-turn-helix transcriptional regulator [Bacillus]|uniref:helix-turn-helix transcriptional regulator n=1 Tax=Bacillus TaxID=1386 RepID=UPI000428FAB9|nr:MULTISPECIES: helix-turn-helix transcriptional regulator [Bacillus]QHZ47820.1 helix-turn-helix domain-containing protein [Bacillus sp. NSP9.1]WFA03899.1 helix-turn-helix transcriptional regulator [Bacillus sp. HSf4]
MDGMKEKRKELGDFLKLKRSTVSPEEYGMPLGQRRRTKGLRREELAQLAGIGVTWYTWLEQGRDIQVSTQVLESISRVLKLNYEEKKHVFLLAGQQIPLYELQSTKQHLNPAVQHLIEHLKDCPVYVTDEKWDVIAWNEAACLVFGDFKRMSHKEKNAIWRCFCSKDYQKLLADWESHAKRLLAQFRFTASRFIGEEWINELIDELSQKSAEFRSWWNHHDILGTPAGEKEINHPSAGTMFMEHVTLQLYDAPDLKLTVYRPLEKENTISKLRMLLSKS